jgi:AGZA family xanthine/uracil permease-like MFS transporter
MGSSSNTAYVESSAGVSECVRTGLNQFLWFVYFYWESCLFQVVYSILEAATAHALIIVGFFMIP